MHCTLCTICRVAQACSIEYAYNRNCIHHVHVTVTWYLKGHTCIWGYALDVVCLQPALDYLDFYPDFTTQYLEEFISNTMTDLLLPDIAREVLAEQQCLVYIKVYTTVSTMYRSYMYVVIPNTWWYILGCLYIHVIMVTYIY